LVVQIKVNAEDIVHESLDGEVVIVNLRNGRYYSLVNVGAEFWELIAGSAQSQQLLNFARSRYLDGGEMAAVVDQFLKELAEEGLVTLSPAETPVGAEAGSGSLPFQAPVLAKHTDMEGLLLLDPVHDVSDEGWPSVTGP
jgi:hypothetical protein